MWVVVKSYCVVVGVGSCRRVPVSSVPETSTESVCPSPLFCLRSTHSGEKPYACPQCDYRSSRTDDLAKQYVRWVVVSGKGSSAFSTQRSARCATIRTAFRCRDRGIGTQQPRRLVQLFPRGRAVRTVVSLGRSPSHSKLCGTAVCCELVRVVAASQQRQLWTGVPLCQCVLGVIRAAVVGGLCYLPSLHAKRTISALAFDPPVVSLLLSL